MLDSEAMESGKKNRGGLRGLFSSSSASLNKEGRKGGTDSGCSTPQLHRFMLKGRNSRATSPSPHSSTSSLGSIIKNNRLSGNITGANESQDLSDRHSERVYESDVPDGSNDGTEYDSTSSHVASYNNTNDTSSGSLNANGVELSDTKGYSQGASRHIGLEYERGKDHTKKKSHSRHLSHLSLKRFLKKFKNESEDHKHKSKHLNILPHHSSVLYKKYGTVGKLLGTGASGSVKLVTSKTDPNEIYAVKKFRARMPTENEHDYKVKVKNEFKIGQHLQHENLIHTIELIKESEIGVTEYYIVMEFCPYDFFNLVMSGLMTQEESACYFKQIINGAAYFQENGLAHRDLKLDNCVVTMDGILKLIDFGSAVQFKKEKIEPTPTDDDIDERFRLVRARGVVGSDPYLAPEVFEPTNIGYDPRPVDVWSIAIMYCCMILKRFPWKIPKVSDPSYKSFLMDSSEPQVDKLANDLNTDLHVSPSAEADKKRVTGPQRLLRLLPRQSRFLIEKMLTVDPTKRYTMSDVINDEFYLSIDVCHTLEDGSVHKPDNHTHHLVTEEELQKLNMEKDRHKKLKDAGVA